MMMLETTDRNPAEIYDEKFVPALFAPWGAIVAELAGIGPGEKVLDVACGTGALTAVVAEKVGPEGRVTGLDINPQMLAVARAKPLAVEWIEAPAERLPFADAAFDAVLSQFGFMFFDDQALALGEMHRVLRPGGRLAVAVCGAVEDSPGYAVFASLLDDLFGEDVGNAFRAPFVLGDAEKLAAICEKAGLAGARIVSRTGSVRFDSIAELVSTERACVWTLGGVLDEGQFELLRRESERALRPFTDADGRIAFAMPSLIIAATK
ncbi:class I SAM-dependent methyltransferase [Nitratireductor mangrovi]|uniref:Class I SAM-dependent methyltransferase n=1 Tax=Nitratireductor mangrovi TaxID=2599600 RepID=A0A5B8L538_9HYPH|nr:methyltransferase domain-containing protein [Nitratireductor mangrovi]QDZ03121.1 class I SAM-dependent methyltransferase [Nitratireductor mangrovi]